MASVTRRDVIDAAADLLLGATCPGCDAPGWGICGACRWLLDAPPVRVPGLRGLEVIAANPYRPVLEHVVPRYKDDGALHLERALAQRLAAAVEAWRPPPGTLLVPVASLPANVRARGFDHGWRLARLAARRTGLGAARLLRRRGGGADQAGLGRGDRQRNLDHAMVARPTPRPVLIVDDIVTTGASLREARRALQQVDVLIVGIATTAYVSESGAMPDKGLTANLGYR